MKKVKKESMVVELVEENVDGCGTDISAVVVFHSKLTADEIKELQTMLAERKRWYLMRDDCYDFDTLVLECLKNFMHPYHFQDVATVSVNF